MVHVEKPLKMLIEIRAVINDYLVEEGCVPLVNEFHIEAPDEDHDRMLAPEVLVVMLDEAIEIQDNPSVIKTLFLAIHHHIHFLKVIDKEADLHELTRFTALLHPWPVYVLNAFPMARVLLGNIVGPF